MLPYLQFFILCSLVEFLRKSVNFLESCFEVQISRYLDIRFEKFCFCSVTFCLTIQKVVRIFIFQQLSYYFVNFLLLIFIYTKMLLILSEMLLIIMDYYFSDVCFSKNSSFTFSLRFLSGDSQFLKFSQIVIVTKKNALLG